MPSKPSDYYMIAAAMTVILMAIGVLPNEDKYTIAAIVWYATANILQAIEHQGGK